MRRILTAAVAMAALALPGIALARGGDRQRAEDHHGIQHRERHHARHRRHARLIAFHAHPPTTTTGVGAGTLPSPSPSPAPVASERAGTIASFTAGTLIITLNDGTTVSGKVTPRTEIECHAASATATAIAADNGDQGRGDGGPGDGSSSGSGAGPSAESGRDGRDDAGDRNDAADNDAADNDAHDEAEHCTPAALVSGASVREALLSVSSAGAFWVRLEL